MQLSIPSTVQISVQSAIETLQICDRQARKDTGKVIDTLYSGYLLLTSPEAKQTYRMIREIVVIACMVAYAAGMSFREWSDRFIASCETQPVRVTVAEVAMPTEDATTVEPAAPTAVVHVATVQKFPALHPAGEVHEFVPPVIGLLPAGVDSKPVKRGKKRSGKNKDLAMA